MPSGQTRYHDNVMLCYVMLERVFLLNIDPYKDYCMADHSLEYNK